MESEDFAFSKESSATYRIGCCGSLKENIRLDFGSLDFIIDDSVLAGEETVGVSFADPIFQEFRVGGGVGALLYKETDGIKETTYIKTVGSEPFRNDGQFEGFP